MSFTLLVIQFNSFKPITGTRYNARGLTNSHVSNHVETEQIIIAKMHMSFVQVRGSIPLLWSQQPCVKYTPKLIWTTDEELTRAHFFELEKQYGKITVVNLVNTRGYEGGICEGLMSLSQSCPSVKYESCI